MSELYYKFTELINIVDPLQYDPTMVTKRKNSVNFYSNFFLAYLAFYNQKFKLNRMNFEIEEIEFDAIKIVSIINVMETVYKLSKIIPICDINLIIKYAVSMLKEDDYVKHEVSYIAAFTTALLYKIKYIDDRQMEVYSGTDYTLVKNILLVMGILDDVLGRREAEALIINGEG